MRVTWVWMMIRTTALVLCDRVAVEVVVVRIDGCMDGWIECYSKVML